MTKKFDDGIKNVMEKLPLHADLYFKKLQNIIQEEKEQDITREDLLKRSVGLENRAQDIIDNFGEEEQQIVRDNRLSSLITPGDKNISRKTGTWV